MKLRHDHEGSVTEAGSEGGMAGGDPAADQLGMRPGPGDDDDETRAEQSVWDEPALSLELSGGRPPTALTYARWVARQRQRTGVWRSWAVTLGVVVASGPWAIVGVFMSWFGGGLGGVGVLGLCVFRPALEELLKVSLCFVVLERRPYLFRSAAQILLCCAASGVVFAAVENVLYLEFYVEAPSALLVAWRWSICLALHSFCTLCAGMGVVRAWRGSERSGKPVNLAVVLPYLGCAVLVHALYNCLVTVMGVLGINP